MRKRESKSSVVQPGIPSSVDSQGEDRLLDSILSQGDSYEVLKTSSSGGAHFQFKSEKSWTLADTPVNSRFKLQISSMSENFDKIPFSERRSMYSKYCSKGPIDQCSLSCTASAEVISNSTNEISWYAEKLDDLDKEWSRIVNVPTAAENNECPTVSGTTPIKERTNQDSSISTQHVNNTPKNICQQTELEKNNKHNLEDWLDSILDD